MGSQGKKWIVRNSEGHIYGPFTQDRLKDLLGRGVFSGEEEAALYPVGDWMPMSADPELYDLVLAQLAKPARANQPKEKTQTASKKKKPGLQKSKKEKTIAQTPKDQTEVIVTSLTKTKKLTEETEDSEKTRILKTESIYGAPTRSLTASTVKTGPKFTHKTKRRNAMVPFILVAAAVALILLAMQPEWLPLSDKSATHLVMPKRTNSNDLEKAQKLMQEGWGVFFRDSFDGYLTAQRKFAGSIESYSGQTDSLTMLLMTYFELWPLAVQDSKDQATVQNVYRWALQSDPYGTKTAIMTAAFDLTLQHDNNTLMGIEQGISKQPSEGRLYYFKGHYFLRRNDYRTAAEYFNRAASLIQRWARPYFLAGYCYHRLGDVSTAQRYFAGALKINSEHAGSLVELGVMEVSYFNRVDKGKAYLKKGLQAERLPPQMESRGRYYLALAESRGGDKSVAIYEAEKALQLDPLNSEIRILLEKLGKKGSIGDIVGDDRQNMALGEQYMRMGNYLGAQARFKAAYAVNPKNARAAMKAAEALWALRQSSDALIYLKKAIQADPRFIESYILLSQYLTEKYDYTGALQTLETAAKNNPNNHQIYRGYAEVYFAKNDLNNAEAAAIRALRMYETDSKANELLSRLYVQKGDVSKALQYAKRSVEIDPANASGHIAFAKAKAMYGGPRDGIEYLKSLILVYPNQLQLRVALAELLNQDEQYGSSKQLLSQVLMVDENNRDAHQIMGEASVATNDYNEALRSFASATRADPTDVKSLLKAGDVHMKLAQFNDAIKKYQLALRINEKAPLVHLSLGRALFNAGQGDLALKELDQEKKLNPKFFEPYELSGDIFMLQRKFQKAVREYQRASEYKPPSAEIYVKLAKAYRGIGSLDAAKTMLKIAANKESGYADIYREQGFIYESQGLADEAVASFRRYLQLKENATDRELILGRISELQ